MKYQKLRKREWDSTKNNVFQSLLGVTPRSLTPKAEVTLPWWLSTVLFGKSLPISFVAAHHHGRRGVLSDNTMSEFANTWGSAYNTLSKGEQTMQVTTHCVLIFAPCDRSMSRMVYPIL